MDAIFAAGLQEELVWLPQLGMGWCGISRDVYTREYYEEFVRRGQTETGRKLNAFRVSFVRDFTSELPVLDYGAGAGDFIRTFGDGAFGYDIAPDAAWALKESGRYAEPSGRWPVISLWDSLEHLPEPAEAVTCAEHWAFVSTPIYLSGETVLRSRHFKPGEHIWYWTKDGLVNWMAKQGFLCRGVSDKETQLGRDSILTFAFERAK